MNDRYLYRAKRTDNGEWVEGYYTYYPDGMDYSEDTKHVILDTSTNPGKLYFVDPSTICQCTGLKDKNGKLIWENDIVICAKYIGGNNVDYCIEKGYVEMRYGAFGLHREQGYYRPFKDWLEDYDYEVIGSAIDNPELLEVES